MLEFAALPCCRVLVFGPGAMLILTTLAGDSPAYGSFLQRDEMVGCQVHVGLKDLQGELWFLHDGSGPDMFGCCSDLRKELRREDLEML